MVLKMTLKFQNILFIPYTMDINFSDVTLKALSHVLLKA